MKAKLYEHTVIVKLYNLEKKICEHSLYWVSTFIYSDSWHMGMLFAGQYGISPPILLF